MTKSLSGVLSAIFIASALVAATGAPAAARGDSEAVASFFSDFIGAHDFDSRP